MVRRFPVEQLHLLCSQTLHEDQTLLIGNAFILHTCTEISMTANKTSLTMENLDRTVDCNGFAQIYFFHGRIFCK